MERLAIEPSTSTPKVAFDPETGILELSGESYPENSFEFYAPILSWLKDYLLVHGDITFNVKIVYMNSSSIKCVLDMLDLMAEAGERGGKVAVNWFYDRENPRALDLAEEFREEAEIPFKIIPVGG